MKTLVFVHGRAQEHKDATALKEEWVGSLRSGLEQLGLSFPLSDGQIRFPYYGQTLFDLVNGAPGQAAEVIVRGELGSSGGGIHPGGPERGDRPGRRHRRADPRGGRAGRGGKRPAELEMGPGRAGGPGPFRARRQQYHPRAGDPGRIPVPPQRRGEGRHRGGRAKGATRGRRVRRGLALTWDGGGIQPAAAGGPAARLARPAAGYSGLATRGHRHRPVPQADRAPPGRVQLVQRLRRPGCGRALPPRLSAVPGAADDRELRGSAEPDAEQARHHRLPQTTQRWPAASTGRSPPEQPGRPARLRLAERPVYRAVLCKAASCTAWALLARTRDAADAADSASHGSAPSTIARNCASAALRSPAGDRDLRFRGTGHSFHGSGS